MNFDDNAAFRQPDVQALRDPTQEDPREVAAEEKGLNYIGLDGNIGCLGNVTALHDDARCAACVRVRWC